MSDNIESFGSRDESSEIMALKRLAHLYHRNGNYEKAEELMRLAEQWKTNERNRNSARNRQGQDAA